MQRKSFTLVETTLFLFIMAVLTAAMIEMIQDYQQSAYTASSKSHLYSVRGTVMSYVRKYPMEVCISPESILNTFKEYGMSKLSIVCTQLDDGTPDPPPLMEIKIAYEAGTYGELDFTRYADTIFILEF